MKLRFHQVDVFTDRVFGGNPLAVFPDADGLTTEQMQRIAREMNLSETTFVQTPTQAGADYKVRIFTPGAELPFAGHPVVGTHWVLAKLGRTKLKAPITMATFELGVGVLPADLHVESGSVTRVTMTQGKPVLGAVLTNIEDLARGLGTDAAAIRNSGAPVQISNTGTDQLIVPFRSLDDVRRLSVTHFDTAALERLIAPLGMHLVFAFCMQAEAKGVHVHARGFAPSIGVPEDPATGSANGALGAYLVANRLVDISASPAIIECEQGIEMHRPSRIRIEVDHDRGNPRAVRVSGSVVPVIEGDLTF